MAEDISQDAAVATPELGQVATSGDGRDITVGYFGTMRVNGDPILAAHGGNLEVYEELLRDDQVQSCFQQRKRAVIAAEWEVLPGGDDRASLMAAASLKDQLSNLEFDETTEMMLQGLFYGYGVSECLYEKDGAQWVIDDIMVRKAKRFRWDMQGGLRLLTLADQVEGELLGPRKFWSYSAGADNNDEPYGRGLGYYCYWPVWLKKNNVKFWAFYQDKFGQPTTVGKFGKDATKEDQNKLLQAAMAIQTDSALIIPDGMALDLLEASRPGSIDYGAFYDRVEGAITKVILSQTMTTDAKATGIGSGNASAHMDVREEVTKSDADLVCGSFNRGPARWVTEWNYPTAKLPRVYRKLEQQEDLNAASERDERLFKMGYRPTEERVAEVYGSGYERVPVPPTAPQVLPGLPGNPSPAFSENTPDEVDGLVGNVEGVAAPVQTALITHVRKALDKANSLAEFQESLEQIGKALPLDEFAALMREGMALAQLTGRADVEDGN